MRNYFDVLRVNRLTSAKQINQALDNLTAEELEDEGDIAEILSNEMRSTHYRRAHLQYDAIAAAISNNDVLTTNSHSWEKRVVEFEPEQNTIELGS